MESLDELLPSSDFTLDDLNAGMQQDKQTVGNKASHIQMAAYAAINQGEGGAVLDNFRAISTGLEEGNPSLAMEVIDAAKRETAGVARTALADFLINPDYDEQTKSQVAQQFLDETNARFNIRNITSERMLVANDDDGLEESVEQERSRLSLSSVIDEVNTAKYLDQQLLNAEVAKSDAETMTAFFDIAQYLAPFQETAMGAQLLGKFRNAMEKGEDFSDVAESALLLAGSAKMEIIEGLKTMPVEQRTQFKVALAELIRKSSSVVMTDENDFARTQMLQTFINEEYTTGEKWVDNVISILDLTAIGGIAGRLLKGGRTGAKAEFIPRDRVDPTMGGKEPRKGKTYQQTWNWEDYEGTGVKAAGSGVRTTRTFEGEVVKDPTGIPDQPRLPAPPKFVHETDAIDTRRFLVSRVQPTSVANNVKDFNASAAATIHKAVVEDVSGEAAQALYGTDRVDAIAHDLAPQISRSDMIVENRVGRIGRGIDRQITPEPELYDFIKRDGAIYYTEAEKNRARAVAYDDFENAAGLTLRHEMSQFGDVDDGIAIKAVYGPSNGGFTSAEDAIAQTLYSLRDYGITRQDLSILVKTPSGYIDVRRLNNTFPPEADYVVQVKHNFKFRPNNTETTDEFTFKRNFFDGFSRSITKQGSVTRMLFDPASVLDPRMTISANVATDRYAALENILLKEGEGFASFFKKLPKEKQERLNDYIKEANHRGIDFDPVRMHADGFGPDEIKAINKWRTAWDNIYFLENQDAVLTLNNRGFKVLTNAKEDTMLFVKPVSKSEVPRGALVYDVDRDYVVPVTDAILNDLYQNGGSAAKLRTPEVIDGENVLYAITSQNPDTTYFRALSENDRVLTHRKGYYQVHYRAPQFVRQRVKDDKGNVLYERAVAVAGSIKDAEVYAKGLARTQGKSYVRGGLNADKTPSDFYISGDTKGEIGYSDDFFDIQHTAGRTAQRVRGQRLRDVSSPNNVGSDHSFIMNPAESLIHASRNIARRVPMRAWLDSMKQRLASQYGHFMPKDQYGRPVFPNSASDIQKPGRNTDKDVRDARTMWEYIRYMEDGYHNALDDGYKAAINFVADVAGNYSSKAERAARTVANSRGPTATAKNLAFNAYLVGHPLRQAIIQSHQLTLLIPNHASYVLSGQLFREMFVGAYGVFGMDAKTISKITGFTEAEVVQLNRDIERSGLLAGVDKQNLARESLSEMAELTSNMPVLKQAKQVLNFARKVGFDFGEKVNMLSAFLAERNKAVRAGKTLTPAELDIIAGKARNYTLNMNAAGDMPYNQNLLSAVFQFLQVPHKALLTGLTNRVMTKEERLKFLGYTAIMFTLPASSMYAIFGDSLPEDPETRELVVQGLQGYMFNKVLTQLSGEKTSIDWSSLGPLDAYGLYEFSTSLWTTAPGEILANTPSGQLFFGNNPRLTNAARELARYFRWVDDIKTPTELTDVAVAAASIFSGMDAQFKAAYIRKYDLKMSSSGAIVARGNSVTAVAQMFGFNTSEEMERAYLKGKMYKDKKKLKEDVAKIYLLTKQHLAREGVSNQDHQFVTKVLSSAWLVFEGEGVEFEARQELQSLIERDVMQGDASLFQQALKQTGFKRDEEIKHELQLIEGWSQEGKQNILDNLEQLDRTIEEEK